MTKASASNVRNKKASTKAMTIDSTISRTGPSAFFDTYPDGCPVDALPPRTSDLALAEETVEPDRDGGTLALRLDINLPTQP
jgi:hypothetical protein